MRFVNACQNPTSVTPLRTYFSLHAPSPRSSSLHRHLSPSLLPHFTAVPPSLLHIHRQSKPNPTRIATFPCSSSSSFPPCLGDHDGQSLFCAQASEQRQLRRQTHNVSQNQKGNEPTHRPFIIYIYIYIYIYILDKKMCFLVLIEDVRQSGGPQPHTHRHLLAIDGFLEGKQITGERRSGMGCRGM